MDVDEVLAPFPTGPRGVAGDLLARLERDALAEQAALDAAARGERPSPAATASKSAGGRDDDRPTYVPGQKRTNGTAAASSSAPVSSTSTLRDSGAGSSSVQAGGAGREGSSNHQGTTTSNNTNNVSTTTRASSPAEPPAAKKARVQPTIRMQFTFPPYPPGKDPIAKHVPIFNVRELAQSKGLLIDPEDEVMDEGSSSGGSDDEGGEEEASGVDNEGGETSVSNAKPKEDETDSQRQLREAIELARRSKKPVMTKKRVLDRDEGYDNTDPFVDDSELAINEPKVQARPKVEGYVAIQGEVEVYDNNLSHTKNDSSTSGADGAGRKGRKAGSVNRPKVPMKQPDGSIKMVSEAIAAREAKKTAKSEGRSVSGPAAPSSASASPAPPASTSAKLQGSPGKPSSSNTTQHAQPAPHEYSSLNPNGLLLSREPAPYSHIASSTSAFGFPESEEKAAQTPPPPSNGTSRPSVPPSSALGSRFSPINIDDGDDGDVDMSFGPPGNGDTSAFGHKQASTSSSAPPSRPSNVFTFDPSPNKKDGKKSYTYNPVSDALEAQLDILRAAVSKESFVPKNKFPPALKPILIETALTAMREGEYDDNFFNIMPNIFPYNRFTMHKMIKREVCEVRCAQLEEEIKVHVEELKSELDKVLPEAIRAHEEQVDKWKEEYAAWELQKGTSQGSGNGALNGLTAEGHQNGRNSLTPVGSEGDPAPPAQATEGGAQDTGPAKPVPKFRFSQNMRMCLFKIMTLSSEVTERQTDKATVEEKDPPSAMNATKARYATLVQLWPEGWMTSNQLSRELTQAKKKVASQMNK